MSVSSQTTETLKSLEDVVQDVEAAKQALDEAIEARRHSILQALSDGLSSQDIAATLGVPVQDIEIVKSANTSLADHARRANRNNGTR